MRNIPSKVMAIVIIALTCYTHTLVGKDPTSTLFTFPSAEQSAWLNAKNSIDKILYSNIDPFEYWSNSLPANSFSTNNITKIQTILIVDDDGGGNYTTITAAIAAASSGDTITVTGGADNIHTESGITINKSLTIQGQGQSTTTVQANAAQNTATERVFTMSAGYTITIQNMTIRHGKDQTINGGGGVRVFNNSNSTLKNLIIENNNSDKDGGGIYVIGSNTLTTLTVENCIIRNNTALEEGGGFYSENSGTFTFTNTLIETNSALSHGGGAYISTSGGTTGTYSFTQTSFAGNTANTNGGGLYLGSGSFTFTNNTINSSTAGGEGGGVYDNTGDNSITIINSTIASNETSTGGSGGGMYLNNSSGTQSIQNAIVANNTSIGNGPDIYFATGSLTTNTSNLVENCASATTCPTFMITSDPILGSATTCSNGLIHIPISDYSPARNMGTVTGAPTTDICGETRYNSPDLGAYDAGLKGRDADSLALVDFYNSTNGASWTTNTNWLSSNSIDTWHGVTVANDRVTRIIMSSNNLTGSIPADLNLDTLTTLSLSNNNLTGGIPNFTNATLLKTFSLQNNSSIGGTIPDFSNLTQLQSIYFNNCGLTGSIPANLLSFPNLTFVVLTSNSLSGSIPSFTQSSLEWLLLGSNGFTGNIPNFSGLSALTTLELNNNNLDGSLPNFNMSSLTSLDVTSNSLSGTIPDLNQMSNLTTLKLGGNSFSGTVPDFTNLGNLATLQIHTNSLDSLPNFSSLPVLSTLEADNNAFTFDDLVPSIFNITTVQYNPQDSILSDTTITVNTASLTLELDVDEGLTNTSYQWYKNGAIDGSALTTSSRTFSNFSVSDTGVYHIQVTNTDAPNLTLHSRALTLNVDCGSLSLSTSVTNVNCNGNSTGAIDLTVTSGVAPYSYSWDNGAGSNEDPSSLAANTYSVTVTDALGCTNTTSGTVTEPADLGIGLTSNNVSCNGGSDGNINITTSGGTTPYSYNWSNGATTEDLSNVVAGSYNLTITDANSCTKTFNFNITEPTAISLSTTQTNVTGNGLSDGSIDLTVSGGTSPYSYNWDNGAGTNEDPSNLAANTYNVTVTDNLGCTQTTSVIITEPNSIGLSFTQVNVSCNGGTNGSIDMTVSGGVNPYTYSWDNGAGTNEDPTGLAANTYNITVTDANSVTATGSVTITEPADLGIGLTSNNVSCNGGSDGNINITTSGGTTPYSYNWSNGATTEDLNNVAAGSYDLTITDANSCTKTFNFNITEPTAISLSTTQTNVSGNGLSDGSIDLTVSGGTSPYSYNWDNGAGSNEDPSNLAANTYNVTVTDNLGCTQTTSVTITEPNSIGLSFTQVNVSCNGGTNGSIDMTVSGGVSPYTYSWDNGAGTNEDPTGLAANTYNVTVTDANSITTTGSVTITEPADLGIGLTSNNVSCNGGSDGNINITTSGGTTPYSYNWSNGATTEDLSNVAAGSYDLTITDANSCTKTFNFNITEPTIIGIGVTTNNVSCNGGSDGNVNLSTNGGTSPYTYNWSNGTANEDLNNVPAGSYSVTITDNQACTKTFNFNITEPAALSLSTVPTNATCNNLSDGSIDLTVSGGTSPYFYSWDNGAGSGEDPSSLSANTYNVTVTDNRSCTETTTVTIANTFVLSSNTTVTNANCNGFTDGSIDLTVSGGTSPYSYLWDNGAGTNEDPSSLGANTYNVTITDNNGCIINSNATITEPTVLTVAVSESQQVLCLGDGKILATPSGGTAPYTYLWDANANNQTSQEASNLAAGTYSVTVTDARGCITSGSATVTSNTSASCTDSLTLVSLYNSTGGSNWTNSWNLNTPITNWHGVTINGSNRVTHIDLTNNNLQGEIPIEMNNLTSLQSLKLSNNSIIALAFLTPLISQNLTQLHIDNNQLTFEDVIKNISAADYLYAPQATVDVSRTDTVAFGAPHFFEANIDFGRTDNTYEWFRDGNSIATTSSNQLLLSSISENDAGTYTYQATNTNAPLLTLSSNPVGLVIINAGNDTSICLNNGAFDLSGSPAGGTWAGTGITNASTGTFDPSVAGVGLHLVSYTVNGTIDYIQVTVYGLPTVEAGNDFVSCNNAGDVTLYGFSPSGGVWSGPGIVDANTGVFNTDTAGGVGSYTLTYTFTNSTTGCAVSDTRLVNVTNGTPVTVGVDAAVCINDAPVTLTSSLSGGVWSGNGVNAVSGEFNPAAAGVGVHPIVYFYGVSPCQTSDTLVMTVQDITVDIVENNFTVCNIDANPITLTGSPMGGTWSGTGISTAGIFTPNNASIPLGVNKYFYTYTDPITNCTATDSIIVTKANCSVFAGLDRTVCINDGLVTLSASPTGGTWSGTGIVDPTNGVFDPSIAGVGTFTLTYSVGTASDDMNLTVSALPNVNAVDTTVCNNPMNFALEGLPSGGLWLSGTGLVNASGLYNTVVGGGVDSVQFAVYEYTDPNGCKSTDTAQISVIFGDTVLAGDDEFTCIIANTYQLLNAQPSGGVWTGPGIISNTSTIDLSVPGLGVHTYTYTSGSGTCLKTDQLQLSVTNTVTLVSAEDSVSVCQGETNLQLPTVSPLGGVWSGSGIVDANQGVFSTSHAGISNSVDSTYTVQYIYDGGTPCEKRYDIKVGVFQNPTIEPSTPDTAIFCLGQEIILNDQFIFEYDLSNSNVSTNWMAFQGNTNLLNATTGEIGSSVADTGSYIITLTNNISGCISKDTITSVIQSFNIPVLAVSDAIVCANEEVIFYVADSNEYGLDTYEFIRVGNAFATGALNDTLQIGFSDSLVVRADSNYLNHGDQIRVLKIDSDGCFAFSNIVQITIDTVPDIMISNQSPNNCFGEEITLSAQAGLTFNTTIPYTFILDGVINQGGLSSIYKTSSLSVGEHEIIVQFENDRSCKNTDTIIVEIDSLPNVVFTVDDDVICIGDNATFTASSDITGSTFDYLVNNNSVTLNGGTTFTSSTLVNNDAVKVYVTSPKSCQDSAFVTMQVDTFPIIDILFASTDTLNMLNDTLCLSDNVLLEASISGTNIIDTSWTSTSSPNSITELMFVTPPRFDFSPTVDSIIGFNYLTITVETEGGCISTDFDSILVKPLPEGPIAYAPNDSLLVCSEDTINLVFQNANNPANTNYFWDVDNFGTIGFGEEGTFEGDSTFSVPINASGVPNTAFVSGYAELDGCVNLDDFNYNLEIVVKPKPDITPPMDLRYCSGDSIQVAPFSVFPSSAIVTWGNNPTGTNAFTLNDLNQLSPSLQGIDTSIIATIEINATLEGCPADQETFEIEVISVPSPPTLYIPNGDRFCEDGNVEVETDEVGKRYEWYLDGILAVDTTDRRLVIDTEGDYYVIAANDECKSDQSNTVNIFQISNLPVLVDDQSVSQDPYFENFENSFAWLPEEEWIVARETYTSFPDWELEEPFGAFINTTPYTTDTILNENVWWTGTNGGHETNQSSWVISPCFDFANYGDTAAQPVLAVSVLLDAATGQNGMSLQFRTNSEEEWRTLGNGNNDALGYNWYDNRNITSFPTHEGSGWSGYYDLTGDNGWKLARFPLDGLNGENGVRFRMVFKAEDNFNGVDEGAAFDNVWIGERFKPTLVEQIIDLDDNGSVDTTQRLYSVLDRDAENIIHLQYHVDDDIANENTTNKGANNARALYYNYDIFNIGKTKAILNGEDQRDVEQFLKPFADDTDDELYDILSLVKQDFTTLEVSRVVNSLEPSIFIMAPIRTETQGNDLTIKTSVHLRDISSIPLEQGRFDGIRAAIDDNKVVVRAVVVEKEVLWIDGNGNTDTLRNVVRDMLPSHAGQLFQNNGAHYNFSWTLNNTNLDNIDIVIFVQNIEDNEVYIARANSQHFVSTNNIVDEKENNIQVFPNPASHYFDVNLDMELQEKAQWFLYDMNGRMIKNGVLPRNAQRLRYDTSDLPAGVYIYSVETTNGKLEPKRIVIAK